MPTNEISFGDFQLCGDVGLWQRPGASSDDVTVKCISSDFKCTLKLSLSGTVLDLTAQLAERMNCASEEVTIICKGRIISISMDLNLRLKSCGLTDGCKLFVSKRPSGPRWISLTVHFVPTDLPPMKLRMHATSPTINVKRQLRELLRAPAARMSLHLADGTQMVDTVTLRDLAIRNDSTLYCILERNGWRDLRDGVHSDFSRLAARVQSLVDGSRLECSYDHTQDDLNEAEELIQEHIYRQTFTPLARVDVPETAPNSHKRRRENTVRRVNGRGNQTCSDQDGTFLGMRRGFLCARRTSSRRIEEPARTASSNKESICTDSAEDLGAADCDAEPCETLLARSSTATGVAVPFGLVGRVATATERARLAGIPSVIRTGRASLAVWNNRSGRAIVRAPSAVPQDPQADTVAKPPAGLPTDPMRRGLDSTITSLPVHTSLSGQPSATLRDPKAEEGACSRTASDGGCACCGRRLVLGAAIRCAWAPRDFSRPAAHAEFLLPVLRMCSR